MQKNYNENLVAGAAIRDDKGRRISKLFEASHPKMTVGYAKNLIMPDTPTEQEFNFRQSGSGVIEDGVAVIDKVKGKSLVWNQKTDMLSPNWYSLNNLIRNEDGGIYVGVTKENACARLEANLPNHKYLIVEMVKGNVNPTSSIGNQSFVLTETINTRYRFYEGEIPAVGFYAGYESQGGYGDDKWFWFKQCIYDLTQMFGAGNEPTTYEEFLSRKPKVADEYAYNEGTIVSNKVEKVKATGVNLWDEEWETSQNEITSKNFNPIIQGVSIYAKCPANSEMRLDWYDANKESIGYRYTQNNEIQVPANTHYFKISTYRYGTTYNHDICINLSDPAINGQYFPYEKHELDLSWVKDIKDADGVKLFEDGMKSAGTAFDEVGKNKAVKRFGVKVFDGNVAITRGEISGDAYRVLFNTVITTSESGAYNTLASNGDGVYAQYNGGYYYDKYAVGFASVADIWLCLPSSVAQTISQVSAYLEEHPITFIYELAEPIEVEYDEKNLTYPVIAGGTEEAIASEPSTAFRADIGYGIDAVKTILDLKARVEALEGK